MEGNKGFYAYPANPSELGETIERAISSVDSQFSIDLWKAMDIVGQFIADKVLSSIDNADYFVADISILNFNVTYEIGYAIGKKKRILLTKNNSVKEIHPTIKDVGIFDTIGYQVYINSEQLKNHLQELEKGSPIDFKELIDTKAPVYLLETKDKTDWVTRIISRIKKSRYIFRSFDPTEQPRLSASEAIDNVSKSFGVIVPLLSTNSVGNEVHNMRGAFIAGLADGMGKALTILQQSEDPVPIDYRDFVKVCPNPKDIDKHIAEFAGKIAEAYQEGTPFQVRDQQTFLQSLDLGASSAENEMRTLSNYYLKTDQFSKSIRGEAHLVIGRKGSGKSAIFLQIRDRERSNSKNVVLDLKPDGYKLIKFKELILNFLQEGTFQHTIMAFWEYVLLLEICYKILEKDKEKHIRDHVLNEPYRKLSELYHAEGYETEGDFSERMTMLMEKITSEYRAKYGVDQGNRLSSQQLTELLYCHDVKELFQHVKNYLKHKNTLWLLFDNIDKGWPTSGLKHEDLLIIRALIDATRKIERQFDKSDIDVNSIVFLRNDVYELLVSETSDRGKEANVLLDWTDSDLLRELIRLRIVANNLDENLAFIHVWPMICISHFEGEETSQYLIDRSLMRPRFLLNLINQCKSFAVNLNHPQIQADDIKKGLAAYSTDLLTDIGYELKDVSPEIEDILYAFIDNKHEATDEQIRSALQAYLGKDELQEVIDLLLWYGFLGVRLSEIDIKYIYNFNYNMQLLKGFIKKMNSKVIYTINPAFWEGLMIEG